MTTDVTLALTNKLTKVYKKCPPETSLPVIVFAILPEETFISFCTPSLILRSEAHTYRAKAMFIFICLSRMMVDSLNQRMLVQFFVLLCLLVLHFLQEAIPFYCSCWLTSTAKKWRKNIAGSGSAISAWPSIISSFFFYHAMRPNTGIYPWN